VIDEGQPPFRIFMPNWSDLSHFLLNAESQVPLSVTEHESASVAIRTSTVHETRSMMTAGLVEDADLKALRDFYLTKPLTALVVSKLFELPS
jgi:hypothetical protein